MGDDTSMYKIKVTEIIDPANFWAQIGNADHMSQLHEFEDTINEFGNRNQNPPVVLDSLKHGQAVLVAHEGNWRRAQIVGIDELDESADVQLIDYKCVCRVPSSQIKVDIPDIAVEFNPCVHKCRLAGIKPIISGKWISRSIQEFSKLVLDQELDCDVLNNDMDPIPLDIFILQDNGVKTVSQLLVDSGVAMECADPATVPKPSDLHINMFNMDIIKKPEQVEPPSSSESEPEADIEQQVALARLGGDSAGAGYSQYSRADSKLQQGLSHQLSYDATIGIHDQVRQFHTSEDSSAGVSDSQETMSPPRFRGRGRMKKLQTHIPEVGASRAVLKPSSHKPSPLKSSASDTQTLTNNSRDSAMPLNRYGLGNKVEQAPQMPQPLEDPVYVKLIKSASGDADSDTPTYIDSDRSRDSPNKRGDRADRSDKAERARLPQQVYSAHDRHIGGKQTHSGVPASKSRSMQFQDYDSSDHSSSPVGKSTRSKGPRRHKPMDMALKQQNEYERRAERLKRDIITILAEDYTDEKQEKLEKLILPKKSVFEGLPGPKELVIFLELVLAKFVEEPESFSNDALYYIQQYQEEEALVQSLSDVVLQMADKYVVASTATTGEATSTTGTTGRTTGTTGRTTGSDHPQNFATMVAKLWVFLGQWNYRAYDSATACVLKLMDKWAMPHIHQVCALQQVVYARCLLYLFREAGPQLLASFTDDFTAILGSLQHRLLASDTAREVKEYYLSIVMLYQEWQVQLLPSAAPTKSCGVQTDPLNTRSDGVQTDAYQTMPQTMSHTMPHTQVVVETSSDPYRRIKKMLKDLNMEDLWSSFEENAVRDSTIYQSDFQDVKDLLKEIGLKAGQILEIKSYLTSPSRTTSPSSAEAPTPSPLPTPPFITPILVSPRTYEETSKRLNNQLSHDMASLSIYANSTNNGEILQGTESTKPKYQPPFRRESDKAKSQSNDLEPSASQQLYAQAKAFLPPPPGFTPLPGAWVSDVKKPEDSRADHDTNWRKKAPPTTPANGNTTSNNGKMTVLGKTKSKSSETPEPVDKHHKKILRETQSFLDHSIKTEPFKLSNPDLSFPPTAPGYFSEQDFPSLSETGGGKRSMRAKSTPPTPPVPSPGSTTTMASRISNKGNNNNSASKKSNPNPPMTVPASQPAFMPTITASKPANKPATTIPPQRRSYPAFCAVCNSSEHETHKCTQLNASNDMIH